jgi:predicted DNA-binding transcriptional regulator YafY
MKVKHIIQRYISIIGRLSNGKRATYEQIKSYLENELDASSKEEELKFSRRTFQREIRDIETTFSIEIKCNADGQYFIADNYQNQDVVNISQTLHLFNYQKHFDQFIDCIVYDKTCKIGSEHLYDIQNAIRLKTCLLIKYKKFDSNEKEEKNRIIAPYGLKEYKGRWYLVGKDLDKNDLRVFGLDRISQIDNMLRTFDVPNNFSIESYFYNVIGLSQKKDDAVEIIEIKFNRTLGNYIKNLPLHHSQQILVDNEDEIRIRLKVIINEELINELIAYGDGAQVIKPKILKNKIIKRAQLILENHKE